MWRDMCEVFWNAFRWLYKVNLRFNLDKSVKSLTTRVYIRVYMCSKQGKPAAVDETQVASVALCHNSSPQSRRCTM